MQRRLPETLHEVLFIPLQLSIHLFIFESIRAIHLRCGWRLPCLEGDKRFDIISFTLKYETTVHETEVLKEAITLHMVRQM